MVIVLSSVIFFVFGYTCGYKYKQNMTTGQAGGGHDTEKTQPVQLHVQSEVRDQDIELNENVAYGPVYHQVCMNTVRHNFVSKCMTMHPANLHQQRY